MRFFFFLFISLFFTATLSAFDLKIQSHSTFVSEKSATAPGDTFYLALRFEHPHEWHSYYKNSGGIELPLSTKWQLSEGLAEPKTHWPTPSVKKGYEGKSFIYSGSPVFLFEFTTPESLQVGDTLKIGLKANWQICKTSCLNESAEFQIDLPIKDESTINPELKALFATARESLPQALPKDTAFSAKPDASDADYVMLKISPLANEPTDFVPNQAYLRALSDGGEVIRNDDGFQLRIKRKKTDFLGEAIVQGNAISGLLIGSENWILPETQIANSTSTSASITSGSYLKILGGMLLGGLILNLMPCVFPVIGLKIMGFVQQAGESRRSVAFHGMSFTIGVLLSFAVLSGLLYLLRAAALESGGDTVNWGYQLQNPWVVFGLLLLMFVLALNMYGLFEIGTKATSIGGKLQSKGGYLGSFSSGVLATIVATPCSAPFLGTAIGATMALPTTQYFIGFAAMALGLSMPYLFLSIFPQFVEKLPRPGAWMESFKQAMSFLLFGTAGYLLWVYSGLIGQENLLLPLIGLCLVAMGFWIYGRWFAPHRTRVTRITSVIIAIISIGFGIFATLPPKPNDLWKTWSQEEVEAALKNDRPVFVDFTAQWCVTCQANKKIAYTDEVIALAKRKNVLFLKADKTRENPAIDAELDALGRSAIPVNALYQKGIEPEITPEILTPSSLIELFSQLPDPE